MTSTEAAAIILPLCPGAESKIAAVLAAPDCAAVFGITRGYAAPGNARAFVNFVSIRRAELATAALEAGADGKLAVMYRTDKAGRADAVAKIQALAAN